MSDYNQPMRALWLALALYAALTVVVFAPFFLYGATFLDSSRLDLDPEQRQTREPLGNGDIATMHLSVVNAFDRALAQGRISIWDPGHLCGVSGMADISFHPFYPPVLAAYAIFDAPTAYMLLIVVHFWLAGFAAHLFARKLGCSFAACVAAALVWLLCNFQAVWAPLNGTFTAVWAPLALTAILCIRRGSIVRPLALAALCAGFVILSSIAQFALYFSLLAFVWLLIHLRSEGVPWLECAGPGALFCGIAMLVSAPEWILRFDIMAESGRVKAVSAADPSEPQVFKGPSAPKAMPRTLAISKLLRGYFGMLPLLAITLMIRPLWRERYARMLLATAAIGIVMSLAFYGALYLGWTTFVYTLFSPRWMILYALGTCGLTAMAIENLLRKIREDAWDGRMQAIVSFMAAGILGAMLLWTNQAAGAGLRVYPSFDLRQITTMLSAAGLAAALTGLFFAAASYIRTLSGLAVVAIVLADLFVHRGAAAPLAPSPKLMSAHPAMRLVARMAARDGPCRSVGYVKYRSAPEGNIFGIYGLECASGLNSFVSARLYVFASLAGAHVSRSCDVWVEALALSNPKARLFNIRYVLMPEEDRVPGHLPLKSLITTSGVTVYEVQDSLPRVFAPKRAQRASPEAILKRLREKDFDPAEELLLEGPEQSIPQSQAKIEIIRYTGDTMTLRVHAESDAFLLISTPYDPGWRAAVDGAPGMIERADYAFMAVRVPAGTHELALWHWPRGLTLALILAAIGTLYVAVLAFLPRFSAEKS